MAKLTKEEQEQLAALRAKEEAPDDDDDDGQGDDGHVIVLRGSRADSFLESLLGPSKPARKAPPAGNGKRPPAGTKSKPGPADDDQGDDDQGDGEEQDDTPPPRANRYFR